MKRFDCVHNAQKVTINNMENIEMCYSKRKSVYTAKVK